MHVYASAPGFWDDMHPQVRSVQPVYFPVRKNGYAPELLNNSFHQEWVCCLTSAVHVLLTYMMHGEVCCTTDCHCVMWLLRLTCPCVPQQLQWHDLPLNVCVYVCLCIPVHVCVCVYDNVCVASWQ